MSMMTPTKIAAAAALLGLFALRGPDGCHGYPDGTTTTKPAPAPVAGKDCLHPIGPDAGGYGQRVADAVNAKNGC